MYIIESIIKLRENCPLSEEEILSNIRHPFDADAYWLDKGTYLNYYAIGQLFKPESYCELGVRFGNSLEAIYLGSGNIKHIFGFDGEFDYPFSCEYVWDKFKDMGLTTLQISKVDLRAITDLQLPIQVDMAQADADHSFQGTYEDCCLLYRYIKHGGILIADDMNYDICRGAVDKFCEEYNQVPHFLECYRGMYIIPICKIND